MTVRAYVTLVTNADFARGARALLRSLALTGTTADRVVMHTGGVPAEALAPLEAQGAKLCKVALLPTSEAFNQRHGRRALHGAAPGLMRWHDSPLLRRSLKLPAPRSPPRVPSAWRPYLPA